MGDGEKDAIDKIAIVVSEDGGDEVKRGRESDGEEDFLDFSKLDYRLQHTPPPASRFKINVPPPANFRSTADQKLIEGLMKELEETKEAMYKHLGPDGLVGSMEKEIAIMVKENRDLKRAFLVVEAEAARVKNMHSDHEGFCERKLAGLKESVDLVCKGKERVEKELAEGVQKYAEVYRVDLEKKLRKEMGEEESKRLQKRREKPKDKGVQCDTTTVPVRIEVRECEMQTDTVPDMIPLPRCTYADVATQAQVIVMGTERPEESSGIKDKDSPPASQVALKVSGDS